MSLEGVEPLTVTLPYPVLPIIRFKAVVDQKANVADVVLVKALEDVWPDDITQHKRLAWNPDADMKPWADGVDSLTLHTTHQFTLEYVQNLGNDTEEDDDDSESDYALLSIRKCITIISSHDPTNEKKWLIRMQVERPTIEDDWEDEWYLRFHLPVRRSRQGTPLLLVTAVDLRQAKRMVLQGDLDERKFAEDCNRIFGDHDEMEELSLFSVAEERIFRHLLRLNASKIQPTKWQKENVPLKEAEPMSPSMATFIRPLYQDWPISRAWDRPSSYPIIVAGGCSKCQKKSEHLKLCGRCKAVPTAASNVSGPPGPSTSRHAPPRFNFFFHFHDDLCPKCCDGIVLK